MRWASWSPFPCSAVSPPQEVAQVICPPAGTCSPVLVRCGPARVLLTADLARRLAETRESLLRPDRALLGRRWRRLVGNPGGGRLISPLLSSSLSSGLSISKSSRGRGGVRMMIGSAGGRPGGSGSGPGAITSEMGVVSLRIRWSAQFDEGVHAHRSSDRWRAIYRPSNTACRSLARSEPSAEAAENGGV